MNWVSGRTRYEEMHKIYNMADVFVLPSIPAKNWKEQSPMVLIEAMSCGTPVIAAGTGSVTEIVGDAGVLVQPNDPTGLSRAIIRLLKDRCMNEDLAKKGRERAVLHYDSCRLSERFGMVFEKICRTSFLGAMAELAEYTGALPADILKKIRSVYPEQQKEWKERVGGQVTPDRVCAFYSGTGTYLYDLVQYNYENPDYIQWTEDIFDFCSKLIAEKGGLKVLDFGGGIGSQLINLSVLKGVKLSYADIPGKTSEYAGWRFSRRHLDIDMIDASKGEFLEDRMYDVIITLDVVEHLVNPDLTAEYLIRHIKPNGHLIMIAYFGDNEGEAAWHLNSDRFSDEGFYGLLTKMGMKMVNEDTPRCFRKLFEDPGDIRIRIDSAASEERFDEARGLMESYLEMHPADLPMLVKYADVCARTGDVDTAIENLNKIFLFEPRMPEAIEVMRKIQGGSNENTFCK
ncbi:MAG: glycosyltransferase [Nitrospirae bacterium]|nr:glycosyltransferase [Nitrospirota bacterium]